MIQAIDISTSALVAQRARLNAIAGNLANMSTTRNEKGEIEPYQARFVVFQTDEELSTPDGAVGVKVASVESEQVEPEYRYQPNHPHAIREGKWKDHVAYPRIDMTTEFVDALSATRSYEANLGVMEISKNMSLQTLKILT